MRILIAIASIFPFFILHRVSNLIYFFVYPVAGYRKKVVRENLLKSFPDQTTEWRLQVEKKFYRNFCDMMVEVMKTGSISKKEFLDRCKFTTPENARLWFQAGFNMDGISSHLGNWEWMALAMCIDLPFDGYAVYKPLSNERMNQYIIQSRGRFGLKLVPLKGVREFFEQKHDQPYLLGLLSDQAPHDYAKAYQVDFLNQKTYYFPGPGLLAVKYNLKPCFGWMRRVGRSRFEWGIDPVDPDHALTLTEEEQKQISRMANAHQISLADSERGYRIVKEYSRMLEDKIEAAPADWLWTHRRWKSRP